MEFLFLKLQLVTGLLSAWVFWNFSEELFAKSDHSLKLHNLRSDTRHKSRLSHVNVFLRDYGGQLKTTVEK